MKKVIINFLRFVRSCLTYVIKRLKGGAEDA